MALRVPLVDEHTDQPLATLAVAIPVSAATLLHEADAGRDLALARQARDDALVVCAFGRLLLPRLRARRLHVAHARLLVVWEQVPPGPSLALRDLPASLAAAFRRVHVVLPGQVPAGLVVHCRLHLAADSAMITLLGSALGRLAGCRRGGRGLVGGLVVGLVCGVGVLVLAVAPVRQPGEDAYGLDLLFLRGRLRLHVAHGVPLVVGVLQAPRPRLAPRLSVAELAAPGRFLHVGHLLQAVTRLVVGVHLDPSTSCRLVGGPRGAGLDQPQYEREDTEDGHRWRTAYSNCSDRP
mmetsp:Transcript_132088/g.368216  ORF Transcript_132088/g.368216 Transcript_132088/m.368216 type:complete len:294 (-) Transcript_132088:19-900(-)